MNREGEKALHIGLREYLSQRNCSEQTKKRKFPGNLMCLRKELRMVINKTKATEEKKKIVFPGKSK